MKTNQKLQFMLTLVAGVFFGGSGVFGTAVTGPPTEPLRNHLGDCQKSVQTAIGLAQADRRWGGFNFKCVSAVV